MDILSNLKYAQGSRKKKKRVGRGIGSGHGKTSTRGHNGAKSRSGHKFKLWFEGGQMPLTRRIPKFGFTPVNRVEYQVVNVALLEKLSNQQQLKGEVTPVALYSIGVLSRKGLPVKILGDGVLTTKLSVSAHAVSKSAAEKIKAAGGTVTILE
jgi:large subunit ribosomal protein L15